VRAALLLIVAGLGLGPGATVARAQDAAPQQTPPGPPFPPPVQDVVEGGDHWRFLTAAGPIHVWRPAKYEKDSAGIVVYVHGYFTDVDTSWREDKLAAQFNASGQNATFIVPESPTGYDDGIHWPSLGDLLRTVKKTLELKLPDDAPIVLVGHSAAYRTLILWLDYPAVDTLILIDALYGNEEDFFGWLTSWKDHWDKRVTIVSFDTKRWAEMFWRRFPRKSAEVLDELPESYDKLTDAQKKARILYIRTATEHMQLIPEGKTMPIVLRRSPLKSLAIAPPSVPQTANP
jgi:hypothetical protein